MTTLNLIIITIGFLVVIYLEWLMPSTNFMTRENCFAGKPPMSFKFQEVCK